LTIKNKMRPQIKPRLIVFDVEGVILPKRRYLLFEASRRLSFLKFLKMLWAGLLYEAGLIPLEKALSRIFKQLQGLTVEDMFQVYRKMPLIPGVKKILEHLREERYKIALISSGLPQFIVDDLAKKVGADYAAGLDVETVENQLTGQISGDVIKPNGKELVLRRIVEKEGLKPDDCIVVADDRNNLPMFKFCSFRIGYNPDFLLSLKSNVVAKGDFGEVLQAITNVGSKEIRVGHSLSKRDFVRETIHISGFFVAVVSMLLGLNSFFVAFLIFIVTAFYVISELARMFGLNIPVTATITWHAALSSEIYEFVTAPIFFALGIMLALIAFPTPVSYGAIAIFTIGDSFATLFGKKFGKHVYPYNRGKKVEGTLLGLLMAWLGAWLFIVNPFKAFAGAAVGMFVETLPTPVNDNLTIPLFSGLTLFLLL
jgi:HAD superfamily phosphoserine phosphatase-like hydrolase